MDSLGNESNSPKNVQLTEAQKMLESFWRREVESIQRVTHDDFRNQELPLARIKKIMKLDEDVKMISGEAPVLFAKAVEMFIAELSLRAWINTEDNKRRTLQRNDIAMAISKFDQFDFLIDIVPREEAKPIKRNNQPSSVLNQEQLNYLLQIAQQQQIPTGNSQPLQLIQPNQGQSFTLPQQVFQVPVPNSTPSQSQDRISSSVVQLNSSSDTQTANDDKSNVALAPILFSNVYNNNGDIVQQIPLTLSPQQYQSLIQNQNSAQNQPIILNPQSLPVSTQYITNGQVVQAIIPASPNANKIPTQNNIQ